MGGRLELSWDNGTSADGIYRSKQEAPSISITRSLDHKEKL